MLLSLITGRLRLREYNTGQIWESEERLRIGRLATNEVCLNHDSVSPRHAEVFRNHEGIWELHGVDGVGAGPLFLSHGNLLSFGEIGVVAEWAPFRSAAEWQACRSPLPLLAAFLPTLWCAPAYDRKLRLWVVAWTRRCWGRVRYSYDSFFGTVPDRVASIVDLLDVNPDEAGRRREELHSEWACWNEELLKEKGRSPFYSEDEAVIRLVAASLSFGAENRILHPEVLAAVYDELQDSRQREVAADADLLRCVLGNPWRQPRIDPAWLLWNGGFVPALANGISAEGSFRELPVLADALEESGCTDEYLLGHLRRPLHCRGCHALDAVLGRHPPFLIPG